MGLKPRDRVISGYKVHPSITQDRIMDAVHRYNSCLDNPGFCVSCGADADGCEPDAERYTCEACEQPAVYGAEELLLILM